MKKQILLAAAVIFSAGMIFITGCKKDDTTGPVITLTGSATDNSILNATYADPGATAEDDEDGPVDVTSDFSTVFNKDIAGNYTITYTATDAAGNESTETRTVTVYNEAKDWAGTYLKANIVDSVFSNPTYTTYVQLYAWQNNMIVTASTTENKKLFFSPFSDYSNIAASQTIYGTITTSTAINITSQVASCGTPQVNHTFQGTGSVMSTSPFTFRLVTSDNTTSGTAYDKVYFTK